MVFNCLSDRNQLRGGMASCESRLQSNPCAAETNNVIGDQHYVKNE